MWFKFHGEMWVFILAGRQQLSSLFYKIWFYLHRKWFFRYVPIFIENVTFYHICEIVYMSHGFTVLAIYLLVIELFLMNIILLLADTCLNFINVSVFHKMHLLSNCECLDKWILVDTCLTLYKKDLHSTKCTTKTLDDSMIQMRYK